jgi:hypothetical protein
VKGYFIAANKLFVGEWRLFSAGNTKETLRNPWVVGVFPFLVVMFHCNILQCSITKRYPPQYVFLKPWNDNDYCFLRETRRHHRHPLILNIWGLWYRTLKKIDTCFQDVMIGPSYFQVSQVSIFWWLLSGWWFGTWILFVHSVGNNHPNWLSYFSEG